MYNAFIVGVGGFFGAISRYIVSNYITKIIPHDFPWGTFTVNLIGSLIMGFLFGLVRKEFLTNEEMKLIFMVGFLGSFTTFSSFALDNFKLLNSSSYSLSVINMGAQNIAGVLLALLGIWLASFV